MKIKKIISFILVLAVMLCSIPVINASAVSGNEIVAYARQYIGYPYVWGGKGPNSFDCSGFVSYVFKHFGISLPSGTSYIWNNPTAYGTIVGTGSIANAKPGDVISWSGHVAIYSGNGYCVQALNPSYGVTEKVKVNSYSTDGVNPNLNYRVLRIYGVNDNVSLAVKVTVDGVEKSNFDGVGTFDVYINGAKTHNDISGYNISHAKGATYEINDIKLYGCYVNAGAESVSGTLNANTTAKFVVETKHTLNDGEITKQPTCTEKGVKTISCLNCDYTSTAEVEALGHSYKETRIDPTCTENAKYVSICSRCNDSTVRVVTEDDIWSDWSEEKPDVDESRIQTKTQYRYMQSETKLSTEAELDGWTLVGKKWGEGKQSTVSYVSSFPSGFSKSNALYNKYNISAPAAYENDTEKVVVGETKTAGYIYWHWCSSSYKGNSPINRLISDSYSNWDSSSNRPYDVFHAFYTTEYRGITASAGAVNFSNSSACNQTYWWHAAIPVKSVSVTTYEMMYEYTRETEWGEWTDNAFSVTDDAKYETRTLYRYSDSADIATGHSWDNGVITTPATDTQNGVKTYTCTVCKETKTETVEKTEQQLGDLNADGKITSADARIALRISSKLEKTDEKLNRIADVNFDNRVTAADARKILRVAAKLETL